jgi:hypothetical protein
MVILGLAYFFAYGGTLWEPAFKALGLQLPTSAAVYVFGIVFSLITGILAVWLYAAIRPRYGAGAKTAMTAGVAFWVFSALIPNLSLGSMGVFPSNVLTIDSIATLVINVIATLLGAWVYKEEAP